MANNFYARAPPCPTITTKIREIDTSYGSDSGETIGEYGESNSKLNLRYLLPFSPSSKSPSVPAGSLTAMVEASRADLVHSSIEDKSYDLSGKRYSISKAADDLIDTLDWSFMSNLQASNPHLFGASIPSHCPSLTSGSTVSSRNSSTRSAKSLRWPGPGRLEEIRYEDVEVDGTLDPESDVDELFFNSKLPVLMHKDPRPYKCPIKSCQYHLRGFARVFDRVRHTNTHFKGTMTCGFCSDVADSTARTFRRQDVFARHLVYVHGAKQVSMFRQRQLLRNSSVTEEQRKPLADKPVATCNLCSEPFDAQGFYEHLPGCTYRQVLGNSEDASDEYLDHTDVDDAKDVSCPDSQIMPQNSTVLVPLVTSPSMSKPPHQGSEPTSASKEATEMEELTASSRCLSLTSSRGVHTSDDETDCTVDDLSPESETEAMTVQPILSPLKRQLIDRIMAEFHHLLDLQPTSFRTHHGGSGGRGGSGSWGGYAESSNASSSGGSPSASRKRSLSGGGSTPPDGRRNDGDDHKRRRPDPSAKNADMSSDIRFACPYYKRNPSRHQTFTSCRDPGFITVARLKEHLYRRHLLPIQCNRCCATFANEPSLREHQRDPKGCAVNEQVPLEGFDKDQERKLKSKKRKLVHQNEEDKWKGVYQILFPDDNEADMPSPYIEYQAPNACLSGQQPDIAQFQEFSRLQLPRLVRRTLEAVVEREAQPLEEKLKEQLVDIVEQCQSQLISMFQSIGGTMNPPESSSPLPAPSAPPRLSDSPLQHSFHDFDFQIPSTVPNPANNQYPIATTQSFTANPIAQDSVDAEKASNASANSGSPDSGYDSTWTAVSYPQDIAFDASFSNDRGYVGFEGFYGFGERNGVDSVFDTCTWPFPDTPAFGNGGAT